jgi:hypothetical protein
MYLDGVLVWKTVRAPNTRIPSGGTLVVGREQDCKGADGIVDGIVSRASFEQTFFCHLVLRTLLTPHGRRLLRLQGHRCGHGGSQHRIWLAGAAGGKAARERSRIIALSRILSCLRHALLRPRSGFLRHH